MTGLGVRHVASCTNNFGGRIVTIPEYFNAIATYTESAITLTQQMQKDYPGVTPDIRKLREIADHCQRKASEFAGDTRTPEDFKDNWHWSLPRNKP